MPRFEPKGLRQWTGGTWSGQPPGRISGFSYDTRILRRDEAFVALVTDKRDGHDFLKEAAERGASMALVSRRVPEVSLPQLVVPDTLKGLHDLARGYRRGLSARVIGITGSCGKTSTKDLLQLLLGEDETLATEGNLNNDIGLPVTLLRTDPERHKRAVIEAGINRPGEMAVLADILQPDVALVTMVGPAHLEHLESLERVAQEKARMLQGARSCGRNYFHASCLQWPPFQDLLADSIVVRSTETHGPNRGAKRVYEYAVDTEAGGGRALAVRMQSGPVLLFPVPHVSPGQAQNAALAVAVALDEGITPDLIRERFRRWKPSRNRGEKLRWGDQWFYADCYNSNPTSVQDAVVAFREAFDPGLRRLYVLGTMDELGESAEDYHRLAGREIYLRPGDVAFLIGRHAEAMLEGLKENSPQPGSYRVFTLTEEALPGVEHFSGAILLKGSRSYRLEQLLPEGATRIEETEGLRC